MLQSPCELAAFKVSRGRLPVHMVRHVSLQPRPIHACERTVPLNDALSFGYESTARSQQEIRLFRNVLRVKTILEHDLGIIMEPSAGAQEA